MFLMCYEILSFGANLWYGPIDCGHEMNKHSRVPSCTNCRSNHQDTCQYIAAVPLQILLSPKVVPGYMLSVKAGSVLP